MADTNPNTPTPSGNTPTVNLAIDRLLNDPSVSSQYTNLESILQKSAGATEAGKTAVEAAKTATEASVTGQYGRDIAQAQQEGAIKLTSAQEAQRGFATSTAAIDKITKDTEKRVNDLEQRKQELLLQNNAVAAGKIADLQFQALQFEQDSKQKAFSNLLSLAGLGFQQAEQARAERGLQLQERAQTFQERSAINSIALQFGVTPTANDTLESITTRVAPFASEKQKLEMAKTRAEINRANAEAAKAQQGLDFNLDPVTTDSLAATLNNLLIAGDQLSMQSAQAILGNITEKKGAQGLAKVQQAAQALRNNMFSTASVTSQIQQDINQEKPESEILAKYETFVTKGLMTPAQYDEAKKILDKKYPRVTFNDFTKNVGETVGQFLSPETYFPGSIKRAQGKK